MIGLSHVEPFAQVPNRTLDVQSQMVGYFGMARRILMQHEVELKIKQILELEPEASDLDVLEAVILLREKLPKSVLRDNDFTARRICADEYVATL